MSTPAIAVVRIETVFRYETGPVDFQEMESTYNSLANGEPKDGQMAWLHGQTHRAFSTSSVEASILVPDTIQYGESLGFIVMICAIIGLVAAVIGWITHSMSYCKEDHVGCAS